MAWCCSPKGISNMPINFRISALVPAGLIVESVIQLDDAVVVTARAGIQVAACHLCGSASRRIHSRYVRQLSQTYRAQVGAYGSGSWHGGFAVRLSIARDRCWSCAFPPFLNLGERCILSQTARETGRAEILIIATGSERAVGWHRTLIATAYSRATSADLGGHARDKSETSPPNFFCIWQRALLRCQRCRARQWRSILPDAVGAHHRRVCSGGATDIAARLIGQWLSERLGQQFLVENRPGASTNVAAEVGRPTRSRMVILFMAFSVTPTQSTPALFTPPQF